MWSRRDLLIGGTALACSPRVSFAQSAGEPSKKFVLIILRGGLDGLAAIAPYGDGDYERARKTLALSSPIHSDSLIDLDGFFGLHRSLEPIHPFWLKGELAIVHATSSPYRSRSHFDAQKVLENGTLLPYGSEDGWLNRALLDLPTPPHPPVAIGRGLPLVLRGGQTAAALDPNRTRRQRPSFIEEVLEMYSDHPALSEALGQHLESQGLLQSTGMGMDRSQLSRNRLIASSQRTGQLLADPNGPNIAVLELSGFDTHIRQGTDQGALANRLEPLAQSIRALADALGPVWEQTVVTVVTEFGRTVSPNGSGGTDHGTASAALLIGGAVDGGRVIADWPGLGPSDLHQGRDLRPTIDLRAVFSAVLHQHLAVARRTIDSVVFPDGPTELPDLIRAA
jgi:uncharacterized protein (DUF1501 family)